MKNNIEMVIYVRSLGHCSKEVNECVKLDLMNPTEANRKYSAFQKKRKEHGMFISNTSMTYDLGINELDSIEWLLDWADKYLQNWDEEQLEVFSELIHEYDWTYASDTVSHYDYKIIEIGDCASEEEAVGRYYSECLDIPDHIKRYFDYERYGRNILEERDNVTTDDYVIIVY